MRTITDEELSNIIINHQHWLNADCDGWEDMRADLSNVDLRNVNLSDVNLRSANLSNANLTNAILYNVNLVNANLRCANLHLANLGYAHLEYANLTYTNLRDALLRHADLNNADLHHADLENANLDNANLHNAMLCHANLHNTNLYNANLQNAFLYLTNLHSAYNIPLIPLACPDTGEFIAWKKAGGYIVKLYIPSDAKRLSATGRKCRCDKAKVLAIENIDGTSADITEIKSDYDSNFIYEIGEIVFVKNFCKDRWNECAEGIHFFINRREAVEYGVLQRRRGTEVANGQGRLQKDK